MDVSAPPTPVAFPQKPLRRTPRAKTRVNSPKTLSEYKLQRREWWEVADAAQRFEQKNTKDFEFDTPEHLPTSPMCPANKKHKSGGTGLCVFHGRRKVSPLPSAE
ncbi:accessory factor associated with RNA polymerase II [Pestalotiopsis sp. 9143b]|nr:accessory factor associated with RNA polymerase II [Pestalotiopsis sp. 9143b]